MGILEKLLSRRPGKLGARVKQAGRLLERGKLDEAAEIFNQVSEAVRAEPGAGTLSPELSETEREALASLRFDFLEAYLKNEQVGEALGLAEKMVEEDPQSMTLVAAVLAEGSVVEPASLALVEQAVIADPKEKKLLLVLSQRLLSQRGENLSEAEVGFLIATARAYPLWKDGVGALADIFLKEGRMDADALAVYRNAYPNRKADRRLRDTSDDAWEAIKSANDPPYLFQRGRLLVDIVSDDDELPILRTLDSAAFRGILDRVADFTEYIAGPYCTQILADL
ncbi:hypothetical protein IIA79_02200, partial [bacterium]|nr:hypothetical protein [bacterium]